MISTKEFGVTKEVTTIEMGSGDICIGAALLEGSNAKGALTFAQMPDNLEVGALDPDREGHPTTYPQNVVITFNEKNFNASIDVIIAQLQKLKALGNTQGE